MRALFLAILALLLAATSAFSHDTYTNWVNRAGKGCCNDHDCRPISDDSVKENGGIVEVELGKHWCPVLPHHYLKTGNAPDWSTAHVCIQALSLSAPLQSLSGSPCNRLLCFQPKPKF
jgi:hypothetical protein